MEKNETDIDIIELLYDVINAREMYSTAIQLLLHKYNKLWIKRLSNAEQDRTLENPVIIPEIAINSKDVKLDYLNKKKNIELKKKFEEQNFIMELLIKKSKCPISQKMDQL